MITPPANRTLALVLILLKEQRREPLSFLWILASPIALYYFQTFQRGELSGRSYLHDSAWFHAYVAITLSLFGFAYYLIGRRESGFIRSFAYHRQAIGIYLVAHYGCFLTTALIYSALFFLATQLPYDGVALSAWLHLLNGFVFVFVASNVAALLCSLMPWRFQTAGVLFSAGSLALLAASALPAATAGAWNPVPAIRQLIIDGPSLWQWAGVITANVIALRLTHRYFRINPVWSRYA